MSEYTLVLKSKYRIVIKLENREILIARGGPRGPAGPGRNVFSVDHIADILNLSDAIKGDIVIATIDKQTYIFGGGDYSNLSDWHELLMSEIIDTSNFMVVSGAATLQEILEQMDRAIAAIQLI